METELHTLYTVLSSYKQSLLKILNTIDKSILQAIQNCDNTRTKISISKKYKISMEMVEVIKDYVKMLYTGENIIEGLTKNFAELEQDTRPERERSDSNPFVRENVIIPSFFLQNRQEVKFEDIFATQTDKTSETSVISDTETLVKMESDLDIEHDETFSSLDYSQRETESPILHEDPFIKREDVMCIENTVENLHMSERENSPKIEKHNETTIEVKSELSVQTERDHLGPQNEHESPYINKNNHCVADLKPQLFKESISQTEEVKIVEEPGNYNQYTVDVKSQSLREPIPQTEDVQIPEEPGNINKYNQCAVDVKPQSSKKPISPKVQNEKPPENIKQDNDYIEVKKRQSRVTFKISPKKEDKKSKSPNKNSAVDKLLKMPPYDWRQECANLLVNKHIRKDFKLKMCTPSTRADSPREGRKKRKESIFDILESDFGKGQKCVFCYIISPSEFYVRTDQQLFESFVMHLNDEMNKSKFIVNKYKDKTEAYSNLGNFCFAFLRDKQKWFRVEVLDWMEFDPLMTEIQLIDYGEKVLCNYQHFKCMIDVYAMFPRMAIRCHFAMIYPPTTDWSPECIKMLNQWCQIEAKKNFTAIFAEREGHSYSADFDSESDPKSLGQMLVDNGMAFEECATEYEYLNTLDEEDLDDYDNINEAVSGYDAKDEARLCPFTDKSGRCFKGPKCKLEHGRLADDGITTDKILTTSQALNQLPLPKPEQYIEILIIGYVNTCHFYAQIITEPSDSLYNANFMRLAEAMKANNVVQTYEKFKVLPGIAELVLVKQDQNWFRGSCVGYGENDEIEIFLVDLGYRTIKKLKHLRQMKDDFLHVPFQAVECILHDCEERKDASVDISQEFFNNCMKMQLFTALVKHTGQPLQIQVRDCNDMEMGYVLKKYGLGQDREVDLTPAKSVPLICG